MHALSQRRRFRLGAGHLEQRPADRPAAVGSRAQRAMAAYDRRRRAGQPSSGSDLIILAVKLCTLPGCRYVIFQRSMFLSSNAAVVTAGGLECAVLGRGARKSIG